jgi:hypothetical protein
MDELSKLIDLFRYAVEQGQTVTLAADDVSVKVGPSTQGNVGQTTIEVMINNPSIGIGS